LVEVRQNRYLKNPDIIQDHESENSKSTKYSDMNVESDFTDCESVLSYNDPTIVITGSNVGSRHSLVENFIQQPGYVVQEQIEEITTTKSYSDVEDMPYNDESIYADLNLNAKQTPLKVPFPEAGVDIVDVNIGFSGLNDDDLSEDSGIKLTDLQTWEENWLFKKKKKANNQSDILYGYMALTMTGCPVSMFIPNPSQKVNTTIGAKEVDELSELSEHNSVGSLEFSDDESENEDELSSCQTLNSISTVEVTDIQTSDRAVTTKNKSLRNKNKPIVKLSPKVPNFMPIELRTSRASSDSDPSFILRPGNACVQSGIIVQFCCKAKGTKPLLYSWFKNDTLLNSDQKIRIFQSGEENILEIDKTNVGDSAHYSCVVYNHFGHQWCDFNLKVRETTFLSNKMNNINKRTRDQNHAKKLKVSLT
jgi:hypothetical protein